MWNSSEPVPGVKLHLFTHNLSPFHPVSGGDSGSKNDTLSVTSNNFKAKYWKKGKSHWLMIILRKVKIWSKIDILRNNWNFGPVKSHSFIFCMASIRPISRDFSRINFMLNFTNLNFVKVLFVQMLPFLAVL